MLMEIQAKHHSRTSKCQKTKTSYNKEKCITQYQHIFASHAKRPLNLIYFFESTWTMYKIVQPTHLRCKKNINFKNSKKKLKTNNNFEIKSSSVRSITIAEQPLDLQGRYNPPTTFNFYNLQKQKRKQEN